MQLAVFVDERAKSMGERVSKGQRSLRKKSNAMPSGGRGLFVVFRLQRAINNLSELFCFVYGDCNSLEPFGCNVCCDRMQSSTGVLQYAAATSSAAVDDPSYSLAWLV